MYSKVLLGWWLGATTAPEHSQRNMNKKTNLANSILGKPRRNALPGREASALRSGFKVPRRMLRRTAKKEKKEKKKKRDRRSGIGALWPSGLPPEAVNTVGTEFPDFGPRSIHSVHTTQPEHSV